MAWRFLRGEAKENEMLSYLYKLGVTIWGVAIRNRNILKNVMHLSSAILGLTLPCSVSPSYSSSLCIPGTKGDTHFLFPTFLSPADFQNVMALREQEQSTGCGMCIWTAQLKKLWSLVR